MSELSNSGGRLHLVQALDSLSANSDCAWAFKDEKEKGKGGRREGGWQKGRKEGMEG